MNETCCKSCHATQTGKYCPECGEVKLSPELRSFRYILKDLATEISDVDGKLWRTLRTLLFHPGQIDYDYSIGRRRIYIKPVTLFLLINVGYVMFATLTDFFVSFYDQLSLQGYSSLVKPYVMNYIEQSGIGYAEFAERYNQLVKVLARSLIIIQVPFFALFMALICYKRDLYSGDYLTFALNYHSWILILFVVGVYPDQFIRWFNQLGILPIGLPYIQWWIIFGGKILYASFAMKTMFQFNWLNVLWRVPLVIVAYYISHTIYRFIQLLITVSLIETS